MLRVACNQIDPDAALLVWHAKQECLFASGADKQRQTELKSLVCELMQTCAVRQHDDMMQHLATLPVVQELGKAGRVQSLHTA
jgi:cell division inhibitor SulA